MKNFILSIAVLTLWIGNLSAQSFISNLNPFPTDTPLHITQKDTIKILAVMVEFAKDKDNTTVGNGKFGSIYSKNYGNTIIDPLPHNRSYFENHLQFAVNYFQKVSKGKVNLSYYVIPDVITLPKIMRDYSPPINSNDLSNLGTFSKDVWQYAAQTNPSFKFDQYNVFLIFHAGVGRDINVPGSLGIERDLPSVYLSFKALKNIFGNNFNGFPADNNFFITNSIILPETESREISQIIGGTSLLQLSINGLIAANIASYLGLPDLYNTETGTSAIGRFGLMDGQGIFAYSGLFPPEPSPWSKIYLGWVKPEVIKSGTHFVNLITDLTAEGNDTTILKVPINSTEYFLVENRQRDAYKNGSKLTVVLNGKTIIKTFKKDQDGYQSFSADSVKGVVTNVDEFDWALPGSGILIWHIDESVIKNKIAENKINTDKNRRGVAVVEADGIQDIGEKFTDIFGNVIIGEGTKNDLWFASNNAKLYKNIFSPTSIPNTNANNGSSSLITFSDFSDLSNKMNFKLSFGEKSVKLLNSFHLPLNKSIASYTLVSTPNSYFYYIMDGSSLIKLDGNGQKIAEVDSFSSVKPAAFYYAGNEYIVGALNNKLNVYSNNSISSITLNSVITSQPIIRYNNNSGKVEIIAGTNSGDLHFLTVNPPPSLSISSNKILSYPNRGAIKQINFDNNFYTLIFKNSFQDVNKNLIQFPDSLFQSILSKDKNGGYLSVVLTNNNHFYIIKKGVVVSDFKINTPNKIEMFSLANLKSDGQNYIIFCNGNSLDAVNYEGIEADNFPFENPDNLNFTGLPLVISLKAQSTASIVAYDEDGDIFAIDGLTGKQIAPFPISAGTEIYVSPIISSVANISTSQKNTNILTIIDKDNDLYTWSLSNTDSSNIYWGGLFGNAQNFAFVPGPKSISIVKTFMPDSQVYNWPNPVYGNETHIRYYVSEDSKITIKIFDLAGDKVDELNSHAVGGMNNETIWNVTNIQSGVYFADVEANGITGKKENKIIKIVIIK